MSSVDVRWLAGVLALLFMTGCSRAEIAAEPLLVATPTAVQIADLALANSAPMLVIEPTLPPPVLNVSELTAAPPATPTAYATVTKSALPTSTAVPTQAPAASPTPTEAPPTFTPPSQTSTSPNDHYRLFRPVPEGGTVWTDKVYPYGSTRGGTLQPHHGVEFAVPSGTDILAAEAGTVVAAGNDLDDVYGRFTNFYGGIIIIEHEFAYRGQPVYTLYGHLSEVFVAAGWQVEAGQVIGKSGSTGIAKGPHLHFEVRVAENDYAKTRNPVLWLYPFKDRGTIAGSATFGDGTLATEVLVTAHRVDGESSYLGSTTYAVGQTNSDDGWRENFAIDDVRAGFYKVQVRYDNKTYKTETWVYPQQTSFVEIILE